MQALADISWQGGNRGGDRGAASYILGQSNELSNKDDNSCRLAHVEHQQHPLHAAKVVRCWATQVGPCEISNLQLEGWHGLEKM